MPKENASPIPKIPESPDNATPTSAQKPPSSNSNNTSSAPVVDEEVTVVEPEKILPKSLSHLTKKYNFAIMSISSGSKIERNAQTLVKHLSRFSFADRDPRPGIVVLKARASCASKMISITEIAKRDIEAEGQGGKWFQYSRVSGELVQMPRNTSSQSDIQTTGIFSSSNSSGAKETQNGDQVIDLEREVESKNQEDVVPPERLQSRRDKSKVRAMPVLTLYMARVSIPELKEEFSEQTNGKSRFVA
jgi:hypothetical protein